MKRDIFFTYISKKLLFLSFSTKQYGKLNMLNIHLHSEDFYCLFMNVLFKYNLRNINKFKSNVESIDLVDEENKVIIQVSATNTKNKINKTLNGAILSKYKEFRFIFISLVEITNSLRNNIYNNPYLMEFDPQNDIYDVNSILNVIKSFNINEMEKVYLFIKDELGNIDESKISSNLATIINILSNNTTALNDNVKVNEYEVERKIEYNDLYSIKDLIDDFSIYYGKINNIYSLYNSEGKDLSLTVLNVIRGFYLKNILKYSNNSELFFVIISEAIEFVKTSSNFNLDISYEELLYCIEIIVVDAFIKCKIFKNPVGYNYDLAI